MNTLKDNVATTLGPRGRNVALYHKEQNVPVITTKTVTVAKFIELEDPFENLGVQVIAKAAEQSVATAGDGNNNSNGIGSRHIPRLSTIPCCWYQLS